MQGDNHRPVPLHHKTHMPPGPDPPGTPALPPSHRAATKGTTPAALPSPRPAKRPVPAAPEAPPGGTGSRSGPRYLTPGPGRGGAWPATDGGVACDRRRRGLRARGGCGRGRGQGLPEQQLRRERFTNSAPSASAAESGLRRHRGRPPPLPSSLSPHLRMPAGEAAQAQVREGWGSTSRGLWSPFPSSSRLTGGTCGRRSPVPLGAASAARGRLCDWPRGGGRGAAAFRDVLRAAGGVHTPPCEERGPEGTPPSEQGRPSRAVPAHRPPLGDRRRKGRCVGGRGSRGGVCVLGGKAREGPGARQPRHPCPLPRQVTSPARRPLPAAPAGGQGRAARAAEGPRHGNPFPRCRPPRNFSLSPLSSRPGSPPPPLLTPRPAPNK